MTDQKDISIVIPAYNEAEKIGFILKEIQEFLYRQTHWQTYEVIVVADGGTDRTAAIVKENCRIFSQLRIVSYQPNRGKGFAVKTGINMTSGRMVAFMDADLSTPLTELFRLAIPIENRIADMAIGSRRVPGSTITVRQPWHRRIMGRCLSFFSRFVIGMIFYDTQCGFKLFDGRVARDLFAKANCPHFGFDLEILSIAIRRGYRIAEIGVTWRNDTASSVRPIKDSIRVLALACQLRLSPQPLRGKTKSIDRSVIIYPGKNYV